MVTEKKIQDFIRDCKAEPDRDFDSDHRLLITSLNTPTTRKSRRKPKQTIAKRKPNLSALNHFNIQKYFQKSIVDMMKENNLQLESSADISSNISNVLTLAREKLLPNEAKKNPVNAIWKTDTDFKNLLNECQNYESASEDYKRITKTIKK